MEDGENNDGDNKSEPILLHNSPYINNEDIIYLLHEKSLLK